MFGKDSWVPEEYETYFRVLETEDEYFPYHKRYHAFWRMYGLGLPDEILKKDLLQKCAEVDSQSGREAISEIVARHSHGPIRILMMINRRQEQA